MKTLYAAAILCVMSFGFIACGPSDAERKADSLAVDSTHKEMKSTEQHLIDSINALFGNSGSDTTKKDSTPKK